MYTVSVKLETRPNIEFNIRELSFIEYKELCKSLFYEEDTNKIVKIFDNLLKNIVDIQPRNVIEKVLLLLESRALTLGTNIRLKVGDKNITIEKDLLTSTYNKPLKVFEYSTDYAKLYFTIPCTFLLNTKNLAEVLSNCLDTIILNDKEINFSTLSSAEKQIILDILPGLPVNLILAELKENLNSMTLTLNKDMHVSPFNESIIYLLKAILIEPYCEVLDMEYNLRRNLSMGSYDLQNTPYPECKILLTKLYKDSKDRENSAPTIGGPIDNGV